MQIIIIKHKHALQGGAGDNTYVVDVSDVVTEDFDGGKDVVQNTASFTSSANVENLTLSGGSTISATGNALNNLLTGNSAANQLSGGVGDDVYIVSSDEAGMWAAPK